MSRKQEMGHVVYSGWMIKSPPEKKLTGPWRIFRAFSGDMSNRSRWKKRYFVLSKPATSLPGTYLLNYFRDECCRKKLGTIDLEQCAEIIESLDSEEFQYLLAIKTTHKGRERTYFLATDTEEQMSTWVRNLCTVCGMKPDETDEGPQPHIREELPPRQTQPQSTFPANAHGVMTRPDPALLETQRPQNHSPAHTSRPSTRTPNPRPKPASQIIPSEEYIPLDTCTSGKSIRTERQLSVDSVPEEKAPPPPLFDRTLDVSGNVFDGPDPYDIPPRIHEGSDDDDDDVYKVPPARPQGPTSQLYDVPPVHSSNGDGKKRDSYGQELYDTPPTREAYAQDDVYDHPPSHDVFTDNDLFSVKPPVRPPKPSHIQDSHGQQDTYMNIPKNSKACSDKDKMDINAIVSLPPQNLGQMNIQELYDTPKSNSEVLQKNKTMGSKEQLSATVPPPSMCVSSEHKYINSHGGGSSVEQEFYLPMNSLSTSPASSLPRKSSSTDNEVEYTDMSGKSSFDDSFEGRTIYDHPPPSRPTAPPPRPAKSSIGEPPQDTYAIFSSSRTRSFKKKAEGSPLIRKKSPLANNNTVPVISQTTVQLPQPVDRHPDFSTSDEDDDEMGNTDVWGTTPPAPPSKDNELKYVDIDHDDSTPIRSAQPIAKPLTEYHDIDFMKTKALQNVKETVSSARSKEKHNT